MYQGPMGKLLDELPKRGDSFSHLCYSYYFRAWKEHPAVMLRKIEKQMEFFYSPREKNICDVNAHLPIARGYQGSLNSFREARNGYVAWAPLDIYEKDLQAPELTKLTTLKLPIRGKLGILNKTFLPVLLFSLAGAVVVFLSGNRYSELRPAAFCTLYLASFNFANSLTISIIYMMDIDRYHFNQITMSLVSQEFGILFLVTMVCQLRWFPLKTNDPK